MQQKKPAKAKRHPVQNTFWDSVTSAPWIYLIIPVSVFLIYGQTLTFYLGKLDEPDIILVNKKLLSDFGNLGNVFFRDAFFSSKNCIFYRPLQNVSFMIDAHLSGTAAWGYYLTNMLIHALTSMLVFRFLVQIGNDRKTALLVTLFFAASPLFVQAIPWAPSRGDLLIALFGMLSVVCLINYIRDRNILFLVIHLAAFLLAVFSKETALLFPAVFLGIWFLLPAGERKVSIHGLVLPLVCYMLIIGSYLFLRSRVVDIAVPSAVFGVLPLLNNLRTIPEFISKFFLPFGLSPMPAFGWFHTLSGLFLIGVLVFLVVRYGPGSMKWIWFGAGWFLLFLIPGMMYSHPMGNDAYDYLEHRSYLPMIGIMIVVYFIVLRWTETRKQSSLAVVILLVCIGYGIYARVYASNYANPGTFYDRAVETNPGSAVALFNRGEITALYDKDYSRAMKDFDQALSIRPNYPKALVNRGICRQALGDTTGALADLDAAARLDPDLFIARKNLAVIKAMLGQKQEAIGEWDVALRISPDYYQGYSERGVLKYQMKDYSAAMQDFDSCLRINGNYPQAYLNRGLVHLMMNDTARACTDWQEAARLGSEQAIGLIDEFCEHKPLQ